MKSTPDDGNVDAAATRSPLGRVRMHERGDVVDRPAGVEIGGLPDGEDGASGGTSSIPKPALATQRSVSPSSGIRDSPPVAAARRRLCRSISWRTLSRPFPDHLRRPPDRLRRQG
jgi:hypothetical protein